MLWSVVLAWIVPFSPFCEFSLAISWLLSLSMLDLKVGCRTYSRINEYLVSFVNVKENKSIR